MAANYGGSMQATIPEISKKFKDKHGKDDFMYLHSAYQPVAPQVPGACGLFFNTHTSIGSEWPTLQRVFTRIGPNMWQYMGMYRLTSSPSLTRREWLDQEPKVSQMIFYWICSTNMFKHLLTGAEDLGKRNIREKLGVILPCTGFCSEKTRTRANGRGGWRLVWWRGPETFSYPRGDNNGVFEWGGGIFIFQFLMCWI